MRLPREMVPLKPGATQHHREFTVQGEALLAFRKQYGRDPKKLTADIDIHRKCNHKRWQYGRTWTCGIASIEHQDKRIGHIFVL